VNSEKTNCRIAVWLLELFTICEMEKAMNPTQRKTPHSARCPECGQMLLCEFSDDELKQLIAGTRSFICANGNDHKSGRNNSWSPTKDEKDAFVKVLLSN
jgi:hypothetical protein